MAEKRFINFTWRIVQWPRGPVVWGFTSHAGVSEGIGSNPGEAKFTFFFWFVFHRIFTPWLVSLYSQCLPITASRDFCDYSVFLVRGSGEEVVFIWEGGLNRGFTANHIPLNCYSSGPKDFHLFAPTFELVPRLKTSRNSFSLSLVFRKNPENETAFTHCCWPPRYI